MEINSHDVHTAEGIQYKVMIRDKNMWKSYKTKYFKKKKKKALSRMI